MGDGAILGRPPLLSGPALPWSPSRPPVMVGTEHAATLALVGFLLLLLALLVVRCFRVLLDPYSSMPASSWSDHKEVLERGQFEYMLV